MRMTFMNDVWDDLYYSRNFLGSENSNELLSRTEFVSCYPRDLIQLQPPTCCSKDRCVRAYIIGSTFVPAKLPIMVIPMPTP